MISSIIIFPKEFSKLRHRHVKGPNLIALVLKTLIITKFHNWPIFIYRLSNSKLWRMRSIWQLWETDWVCRHCQIWLLRGPCWDCKDWSPTEIRGVHGLLPHIQMCQTIGQDLLPNQRYYVVCTNVPPWSLTSQIFPVLRYRYYGVSANKTLYIIQTTWISPLYDRFLICFECNAGLFLINSARL